MPLNDDYSGSLPRQTVITSAHTSNRQQPRGQLPAQGNEDGTSETRVESEPITRQLPEQDTSSRPGMTASSRSMSGQYDSDYRGSGRRSQDQLPTSRISRPLQNQNSSAGTPSRRQTSDSITSTTGSANSLQRPIPVRPRETGEERQFDHGLATLLRTFAGIHRGAFSNVATYMRENPTLLSTDPQRLLEEAARAYAFGKREYCESCVQQAVILKSLRQKSSDGRRRDPKLFFKGLLDKKSDTLYYFYKDFDKALKEAKERAKSVSSDDQLLFYGVESQKGDGVGAAAESGNSQAPKQIPQSHPSSEAFATNTASYTSFQQLPPNRLTSSARYGQLPVGYGTPAPGQDLSAQIQYTDFDAAGKSAGMQNSHLGGNIGHATSRTGGCGIQPSQGSENVPAMSSVPAGPVPISRVKGEDTVADLPSDRLDPRFILRESMFYRLGRVFAVVWHDEWSEKAQNPTSSRYTYTSNNDGAMSIGRFGVKIHTTVRRMVVVRQGHGFCVCIQVNTYAGRGLAKFRKSNEDVQSHSIIYMDDTEPKRLLNEPRSQKQSIPVRKARPEQHLDRASRLCYSRPHTVEHTVKSMDVGIITGEHLKAVLQFYAQINNIF